MRYGQGPGQKPRAKLPNGSRAYPHDGSLRLHRSGACHRLEDPWAPWAWVNYRGPRRHNVAVGHRCRRPGTSWQMGRGKPGSLPSGRDHQEDEVERSR